MSKVQVCRKHNLDEDECRSLAQNLLQQLVGEFGGSFKENGGYYSYKHATGINAQITPKAGELIVDVKLGIMTRSFAPQLEVKVNEVLDEYLA